MAQCCDCCDKLIGNMSGFVYLIANIDFPLHVERHCNARRPLQRFKAAA